MTTEWTDFDSAQELNVHYLNSRLNTIFSYHSGSPDHPCLTNRGGCSHICIPLGSSQRKCGCSVGYTIGETDTECKQYSSFAVVSQLKTARGFDLNNSAEAMVPISGKGKTLNFTTPSEKDYVNNLVFKTSQALLKSALRCKDRVP